MVEEPVYYCVVCVCGELCGGFLYGEFYGVI